MQFSIWSVITLWILLPVIINWSGFIRKNGRFTRPFWQIMSLPVALPSLTFFALLAFIAVTLLKILDFFMGVLSLAVSRVMLTHIKAGLERPENADKNIFK